MSLEALRSGHRSDFRGLTEPRCPHCGVDCEVVDNEWYRILDEGLHEVECPSCGQEFEVTTNVTYTFSVDEQDAIEDAETDAIEQTETGE